MLLNEKVMNWIEKKKVLKVLGTIAAVIVLPIWVTVPSIIALYMKDASEKNKGEE